MKAAIRYPKPCRRKVTEWLLFLLLILIATTNPIDVKAEEEIGEEQRVRVMFYNVENLFDTVDDPETDDREFLPDGSYQWSEKRYKRKLQHIAWVISNIAGWDYPGIIGLVEVENREVIEDLISQRSLRKVPYQYAVTKGADPRGIDVALLWDSRRYRLVHANEVPHYGQPLSYPLRKDPRTPEQRDGSGRNSLWITLQNKKNGKMMDIFVVHAPSRRGGVRPTSAKRAEVAKKIQQLIKKIKMKHMDSRILVMGDFNDNPSSRPVKEALQACKIEPQDSIFDPLQLYNLAYPIEREGSGTHSFEGGLWTPDQIIVSGNLLNEIPDKRIEIFKHPELWDPKRKVIHRTYSGPFYKGGYSDHLPIFIDIEL